MNNFGQVYIFACTRGRFIRLCSLRRLVKRKCFRIQNSPKEQVPSVPCTDRVFIIQVGGQWPAMFVLVESLAAIVVGVELLLKWIRVLMANLLM